MKSETEESGLSDEELRKHAISMITPPSEAEGETTWAESEPISEKRKEELLDAVRSRRSIDEQSDTPLSDAEYLFDLIRKDENEQVLERSENEDGDETASSPVEEVPVTDTKVDMRTLKIRNADFYRGSKDEIDQSKIEASNKGDKVVSFKKYFIPLGMAAALAMAFLPLMQDSRETQYTGVDLDLGRIRGRCAEVMEKLIRLFCPTGLLRSLIPTRTNGMLG